MKFVVQLLRDDRIESRTVVNEEDARIYVLTEIQTTCIMLLLYGTLWSGNGGCAPYCGLTPVA